MKFKYKKIILLIFLGTMGIGILTMALAPRNGKTKDNSDAISSEDENISATPAAAILTVTPSVVAEPTLIPTPTAVPTPMTLPVYELEDQGYPKIEAVVKAYYEAKVNCDIEVLKTLFSDPADVPSLEQLQKEVLYIESYPSILCYVKKSFEEGSYIVFVYNEIKFVNIDTPAPAVDRFYMIKNKNGEVKIFSDPLDEETHKYYLARLYDEDVQELLEETNAKWEAAKAKDEYLRNFSEGLISTQDESGEDTTDE